MKLAINMLFFKTMKMHIGLYYKDGGIECRIYCKNYKYTFHISETDQNIEEKEPERDKYAEQRPCSPHLQCQGKGPQKS